MGQRYSSQQLKRKGERIMETLIIIILGYALFFRWAWLEIDNHFERVRAKARKEYRN